MPALILFSAIFGVFSKIDVVQKMGNHIPEEVTAIVGGAMVFFFIAQHDMTRAYIFPTARWFRATIWGLLLAVPPFIIIPRVWPQLPFGANGFHIAFIFSGTVAGAILKLAWGKSGSSTAIIDSSRFAVRQLFLNLAQLEDHALRRHVDHVSGWDKVAWEELCRDFAEVCEYAKSTNGWQGFYIYTIPCRAKLRGLRAKRASYPRDELWPHLIKVLYIRKALGCVQLPRQ